MSELDPNTMLSQESQSTDWDLGNFKNDKQYYARMRSKGENLRQAEYNPTGDKLGGLLGPEGTDYIPDEISYGDIYDPAKLEQLRGETQGSWSMFGNSMMQVVGSELIGGTIAGLGYIVGNDDLAEAGEHIQNGIREYAPIHQSSGQDALLSDKASTFGWYMENMPSVASSLSLMVPALGATKVLSLAGKIAKIEKFTSSSAKIIANLHKAEKVAKLAGDAEKLAKVEKSIRGIRNLGAYAVQGTVSRMGENGMEGKQTYDEELRNAVPKLQQKYSQDINQEKAQLIANNQGRVLDSQLQEMVAEVDNKWNTKINQEAEGIANNAKNKNNNYNWVLGIQDIAQYALLGGIFKAGGKAGMRATWSSGSKNKAAKMAGLGALDIAGEAGEEMYQWRAGKEAMLQAELEAGLVQDDVVNPTLGGRIRETFTESEAIESGIWGALGAGVFQGAGRGLRNLMATQEGKKIPGYQSEYEKQLQSLKYNQEALGTFAKQTQEAVTKGDVEAQQEAINMGLTDQAVRSMQDGTGQNLLTSLASLQQSNPSDGQLAMVGMTKDQVPAVAENAKAAYELVENAQNLFVSNLQKYKDPSIAGMVTKIQSQLSSKAANLNNYKAKLEEVAESIPGYKGFDPAQKELLFARTYKKSLNKMKTKLEKESSKGSQQEKENKNALDRINRNLKEVNETIDGINENENEGVPKVTLPNVKSTEFDEYTELTSKMAQDEATIGEAQTKLQTYDKPEFFSTIEEARRAKGQKEVKKAVDKVTTIEQLEALDETFAGITTTTELEELEAAANKEEFSKAVEATSKEQNAKAKPLNISKLINESDSLTALVDVLRDENVGTSEDSPRLDKDTVNEAITTLTEELDARYENNPHLQFADFKTYDATTTKQLAAVIIDKYTKNDAGAAEIEAYFGKNYSPIISEQSAQDRADAGTNETKDRGEEVNEVEETTLEEEYEKTDLEQEPEKSEKLPVEKEQPKPQTSPNPTTKTNAELNILRSKFGSDVVDNKKLGISSVDHDALGIELGRSEAVESDYEDYDDSAYQLEREEYEKYESDYRARKIKYNAELANTQQSIPSSSNIAVMSAEPALATVEGDTRHEFWTTQDFQTNKGGEWTGIDYEYLYNNPIEKNEELHLEIDLDKQDSERGLSIQMVTYKSGERKPVGLVISEAEASTKWNDANKDNPTKIKALYDQAKQLTNGKNTGVIKLGLKVQTKTSLNLESEKLSLRFNPKTEIKKNGKTKEVGTTTSVTPLVNNNGRNISFGVSLDNGKISMGANEALEDSIYLKALKNSTIEIKPGDTFMFIETPAKTLFPVKIELSNLKSNQRLMAETRELVLGEIREAFGQSQDLIDAFNTDNISDMNTEIIRQLSSNMVDPSLVDNYNDVAGVLTKLVSDIAYKMDYQRLTNARQEKIVDSLINTIDKYISKQDRKRGAEAIEELPRFLTNELINKIKSLPVTISVTDEAIDQSVVDTYIKEEMIESTLDNKAPIKMNLSILNQMIPLDQEFTQIKPEEEMTESEEENTDTTKETASEAFNAVTDYTEEDFDEDEDGDPKEVLSRTMPESDKTTNKAEYDWAKSVLGDDFSIESVDRLITIDKQGGRYAWGIFKQNLIKYHKNAPLGTIRHEAFHAVFHLGMTEKERTLALRRNSEEDLAEKFETYVDSFGKDYSGLTGIIRSFFRQIYEMIKMRIGSNMSTDDLFFRIHTGLYKKSTIKASKEFKPNSYSERTTRYKERLDGVRGVVKEDLVASISNMVSDIIDASVINEKANPRKLSRQEFVNFRGVDNLIRDAVRVITPQVNEEGLRALMLVSGEMKDTGRKNKAGKSIERFQMNDNVISLGVKSNLESSEGVVTKSLGLVNDTGNAFWISESHAVSLSKKLSDTTSRALFRIQELDRVTGKTVMSSIGLPKYIRVSESMNALKHAASDVSSQHIMMREFRNMAEQSPKYGNIVKMLEKDPKLQQSFFKNFRLTLAKTDRIVVDSEINSKTGLKEITRRLVKSNKDFNSSRYNNGFIDSYERSGMLEGDNYNQEVLNEFKAVYSKFNEEKPDTLLVTAMAELAGLNEDISIITSNTATKAKKYLFRLFKAINDGKNLTSGTNVQTNKDLKNYSYELSKFKPREFEASYPNIDGEIQMSHRNQSYLSRLAAKIQDPVDGSKYIDKLSKQIFTKDSPWVKALRSSGARSKFMYTLIEGIAYNKDSDKNDTGYSTMSTREYSSARVEAYLNNSLTGTKLSKKDYRMKPAKYVLPVLSDSSLMPAIEFARYTEDQVVEHMFAVALQEHSRRMMIPVLKAEGKDVKNLIRRGDDFLMMPFLNAHKDLFDGELVDNERVGGIGDSVNDAEIKKLIKAWLDEETVKEIEAMKDDGSYNDINPNAAILFKNSSAPIPTSLADKNTATENATNAFIKDYVYNSILATSQIITLTAGDLAMYKDETDFFKRYKQTTSPGIPLNLDATFYSIEEGREIQVRDKFNAAYVEDAMWSIDPVSEAKMIKLYTNKGYSLEYVTTLLNEFKGKESTDGQTFVSLSRYREIKIGNQDWTNELESAYQNLINGTHSNEDAKKISMNPIKPYYYNQEEMDINGFKLAIPTQIKNSEMVLLPEMFSPNSQFYDKLKNTPLFKIYTEHMAPGITNNRVDSLVYSSAIKVGQYDLTEIKDGTLNTIIHELSNDSYLYQMDTPVHHINHEIIFGSQLRKIITANLPEGFRVNVNGVDMSKDQVVSIYNELTQANLEDSAEAFDKLFSDQDSIERRVQQEVFDKELRSDTLLGFEKVVTGVDQDGKDIVENILPFSSGAMARQLAPIYLSEGRKIIKQKINGAQLIQFTDAIADDSLKVKRDASGAIIHMEAILPMTAKNMFGLKEGDPIPEELTEMLGFRIPTEDKSSAVVIRVKGFADNQAYSSKESGGVIALPPEVITYTGSDFDIDKFFLMIKKEERVPDSKTRRSDEEIEATILAKGWIYNDKKGYDALVRKLPEVDKFTWKIQAIKYDESIPASENSKSARDNKIIDVMIAILRSPEIADLVQLPSDFTAMDTAAKAINKLKSGDEYQVKTPITPRSNIIMQKRNMTGAKLIGVAAINSMLQGAIENNAKLKKPISIGGIYKSEFNRYSLLETDVEVAANKVAKAEGIKVDGKLMADVRKVISTFSSGDRVASKTLRRLTAAYGETFFTPVARTIKEFAAATVDNAKNPVSGFLGVNMATANQYTMGLMLGFSHYDMGLLLNQPSIVKLADEILDKDLTGQDIEDAINRLLNEYNNATPVQFTESLIDSYTKTIGDNSKLDKDYVNAIQIKALIEYKDLNEVSQILSGKTKAFRTDNTGNLLTIEALEEYFIKVNKIYSSTTKRPDDVNDIVGLDAIVSKEGSLGRIFFENGVKNIYSTLSKEFIQLSPTFKNIKTFIGQVQDVNISSVNIKKINDAFKGYLDSEFINSPNHLGLTIGARQGLLESFPDDLEATLADNPYLKEQFSLLAALEVENIPSGNSTVSKNITRHIKIFNTTARKGYDILDKADSWDRLLDSENKLEKEIGQKLFLYSASMSNGVFTPASIDPFMPMKQLISLKGKNGTVTYAEFQRQQKRASDAGSEIVNFKDFAVKYLIHNINTSMVPLKAEFDKGETASMLKSDGILLKFTHKKDQGQALPLIIKVNTKAGIVPFMLVATNTYIRMNKLGYGKFLNEYFNSGDNTLSIVDSNNVGYNNPKLRADYEAMLQGLNIVSAINTSRVVGNTSLLSKAAPKDIQQGVTTPTIADEYTPEQEGVFVDFNEPDPNVVDFTDPEARYIEFDEETEMVTDFVEPKAPKQLDLLRQNVSMIKIINKNYSRESLDNDSNSMYLFTDNAERTSRPKASAPNITKGWYAEKYKDKTNKPLHFGSVNNPTSAVIRGKNNAYPISTMSAYGTNWTVDNFELFKDTVNDEMGQIKNDLSKFDNIKIGNYRIGQGGRFAKLPKQHQDYLDTMLAEIGIDNTGNKPIVIETKPQAPKQLDLFNDFEGKSKLQNVGLSEIDIALLSDQEKKNIEKKKCN